MAQLRDVGALMVAYVDELRNGALEMALAHE
jgi:hypothetical protein